MVPFCVATYTALCWAPSGKDPGRLLEVAIVRYSGCAFICPSTCSANRHVILPEPETNCGVNVCSVGFNPVWLVLTCQVVMSIWASATLLQQRRAENTERRTPGNDLRVIHRSNHGDTVG